jgi:hypothetical protein
MLRFYVVWIQQRKKKRPGSERFYGLEAHAKVLKNPYFAIWELESQLGDERASLPVVLSVACISTRYNALGGRIVESPAVGHSKIWKSRRAVYFSPRLGSVGTLSLVGT